MLSAEAGLPRARSSITRSSIETAKVTPAAFNTCRSTGASSHGFCGSRRSGGVLARMLSRSPIRSPLIPRSACAGACLLAERAHGGKLRADVEQALVANRDHGRTSDLR